VWRTESARMDRAEPPSDRTCDRSAAHSARTRKRHTRHPLPRGAATACRAKCLPSARATRSVRTPLRPRHRKGTPRCASHGWRRPRNSRRSRSTWRPEAGANPPVLTSHYSRQGVKHRPERRQVDPQCVIETMHGLRHGAQPGLRVVPGTAEFRIVRVEYLAIFTALDADGIVIPRYRSRIEYANDRRPCILPDGSTLECPDARSGIMQIQPAKSLVIAIARVKLGGGAVKMVELASAVAQAEMRQVLQLQPIELIVLAPLLPLPEFSPHEQQLLAGMCAHVGNQQAEIRALLP